MPNAVVVKLMEKVINLEKQVAVLMSWHKVQTGMLGIVLTAVLGILVVLFAGRH